MDKQFYDLNEKFQKMQKELDDKHKKELEILQEESDSADEDKWYPKYKDCECCKGFVYKCKGDACQSLGQCYCKMKDDCDNDED